MPSLMDSLNPSLHFNPEQTVEEISQSIVNALRHSLKRRGLVVAVSGGIDSSVCAALAVKALGKNKVFCLLMPEKDSKSISTDRGQQLVEHLGVEHEIKNIAPTLEAIGCYDWRDNAIREVFPEYTDQWKNKIVIDGGIKGQINRFQIVVQNPAGETFTETLPLKPYATIVAATNFKQRIRKNLEYFHADRLNYAVVGTPNRLEFDQGFFVKGGDGLADIKPIAHLYKSQVYALAEYLGLPEEIVSATPTTDTYSLEQGQDEFYFALPYNQLDVALAFFNKDRSAEDLAKELNLTTEQAQWVYKDISNKRKTTEYMHLDAVKVQDVCLAKRE